jgi:GDPmannose 4,6-dehydratase
MRALIFGCTGQDGPYLAELLGAKGYDVHGACRPRSGARPVSACTIHQCDITDAAAVEALISEIAPHEIYNLAAQSHVGTSFGIPAYTSQVTGLGALNVLEGFRRHAPNARFYQASSSEMFGNAHAPQNESTPFHPVSPYGVAKLYAHKMAVHYRETHGLHVSCGILFNHESPRRGEQFVTRKICKGLARIKAGLQDKLMLGNLTARRDWGYAPEYVEAMWRMVKRDEPGDYVIGTGCAHSVADFLQHAIHAAGLTDYDIIDNHPQSVRPSEIHELRADASKAEYDLGWKPTVFMPDIARIMMEAELEALGIE